MRIGRKSLVIIRMLLPAILTASFLRQSNQNAQAAIQIDIHGPAGSGKFGTTVTVLPNGNLVITDPYYDSESAVDVGAVYLYDGVSGAQISMLTGTTTGDQVGSGGASVLSNDKFLVSSPYWDNGTVFDASAITWGDGNSGVSGVVSEANSLAGSTTGDSLGSGGTAPLGNGNYLVRSPQWDNGTATNAGAVTWVNGDSGIAGEVSALNSLVGNTSFDLIGYFYVTVLSNGNYVVNSPFWDNETSVNAGAVTWGDGNQGVSDEITALNSLVGSTASDEVGYHNLILQGNGNFLVMSPLWDNGAAKDAGAVTWVNGDSGIAGEITALNSLVGSSTGDLVGYVVPLKNNNYVVSTQSWNNGLKNDAGAVTWGDGNSGVTGKVSVLNSLVGSSAGDCIGEVIPLSNGNYIVSSLYWDNEAAANVGAVTWVNGNSGISGEVTALNSLVGSTPGDQVGIEGAPLSNGNYVVSSPFWDSSVAVDVGAVTWVNGNSGITGEINALNSLVGSTPEDWIGDTSYSTNNVIPLSNGNYLVLSGYWDKGANANVGAVTWGDGSRGVTGEISALNSLVGGTTEDQVGSGFVIELSSGNYVVSSPYWDNEEAVDAGAVTWGDGNVGIAGEVSALNSLVGSTSEDEVGYVTALKNGDYLVNSPLWDNEEATDAGAVTWGDGNSGIKGLVSAANSLVGSQVGDYVGLAFSYTPGVIQLNNGNYLVVSYLWNDGSGAVTWGSGSSGVRGKVSELNSLVGVAFEDGYTDTGGIRELNNGNYVVSSLKWNGWKGSATWGDGSKGVTGQVSALNSLVGSTAGDQVGVVLSLSDGNYVVISSDWHNATGTKVGATTWGDGSSGKTGEVSEINSLVGNFHDDGNSLRAYNLGESGYAVNCPSCDQLPSIPNTGAISWNIGQGGITGLRTPGNSVFGTTAFGGFGMNYGYDRVYDQLVVGRPADNIVTLFRKTGEQQKKLYLPVIVK